MPFTQRTIPSHFSRKSAISSSRFTTRRVSASAADFTSSSLKVQFEAFFRAWSNFSAELASKLLQQMAAPRVLLRAPCMSPVVDYHGLVRRFRVRLYFQMRPQLNSGTLGGPRIDHQGADL